MRRGGQLADLGQDLRLALRRLAADRGFTAAAVLTLALGIGAAAAMLTVVNAVFRQALPYVQPERLVMLTGSFDDQGEIKPWPVSQMDFGDWRARSTVFADMSVRGSLAFNLEQGARSQRVWGELVDASYFRLLGVAPARGRFFTAEEDARPLERYVVVLGYGLWQSSFGADPGMVGRSLQLNGRSYEVVGIGPRGFRGLSDQADLWVPSMLPPIRQFLTNRGVRWVAGAARLKPGVSVAQAQQQMNSVTAGLALEMPATNKGLNAAVVPLKEFWFGKLRNGLLVLTVGAVILLLIACVNVASLLLTRAVARQRDWGIRVALGASRGRLARELLAESLLLAAGGAAGGLVLAQWATGALVAVSGVQFPSFVHIAVDPWVAAATVGLAALCGLFFGLAPLAWSLRDDLVQSLTRGDKGGPRGQGWQRIQHGVVIVQVALALTLAVDAGLMAQGFRKLTGQQLGFRADDLLTWRIDLRGPKYAADRAVTELLRREYQRRIEAVPGVEQVAMSDPTLPTDEPAGGYITIEDHDSTLPDGTYVAMIHAVSPRYFAVLGVPIERGRPFGAEDTESNAVIVSRALAAAQWPGQDPIGKRLKLDARSDAGPWLTVVGVAADLRQQGIAGEKAAAPDLYLSLLQFIRRPPLTINFLVRPQPGVAAARLRAALHREMAAIDPELPDYDVATMRGRLARQADKARFQIILIVTFAALALALAAVGIYGVISYSVAQRGREISIRMSLGAGRGSILRLVVGRGAVVAAIGVGLGLGVVVALGGLLAGLLFQTSLYDPLVLGGTSAGLFLVTLAANYLPARRAARLDPMTVLRLR
jgi:predicted permease